MQVIRSPLAVRLVRLDRTRPKARRVGQSHLEHEVDLVGDATIDSLRRA